MIELIPESYVDRLDLTKVFGRTAPLIVDLGCGDGSFLIAMAERFPAKNFLGVERMAGRVSKTCRKAGPNRTGGELRNVRVLHLESSYVVQFLLPQNSVETFYLLFPDPWPKRRHQRRRVMSPDFLDALHAALAFDGILHMATDQRDYFTAMEHLASGDKRFETVDSEINLPQTKFERTFREQGAPIYRLSLRKISPVR